LDGESGPGAPPRFTMAGAAFASDAERLMLPREHCAEEDAIASTILGGSGADALAGTAGADLILGFDPDGPANQVGGIEAARVAAGLSQPVFATAPPDDPARLFVVERTGRIQTLDLGTGAVAPTPFLDLTGQVATAGE
jgi:hypothetical protein